MSTISISAPFKLIVLGLLLPLVGRAADPEIDFGGHSKTWVLADSYPEESVFHPLTGDAAGSLQEEVRLSLSARKNAWTFDAAWQVYATWGDRVELLREAAGSSLPGIAYLPNDDRRLMNLTSTIHDDGNLAAVHRLDRLSLAWTSDNVVVRAGRQAISWGNGLVFSPMDIVNPFDPTTVDTEFKAGDDMVYLQYLLASGNDVELAHVFRRDPVTGDPSTAQSTTAVKYHGIVGDAGYDVLVADNYDDLTIAIGGNKSLGGAVLHGDVVWMDTDAGSRLQLVTNVSYSWTWGGRNVSGLVEYYYSEFGQRSGRYDLPDLAANTGLIERLRRGESFTLGRNYLAGAATIEMTPLWLLTPTMFVNIDDGSALLQVVTRNNIRDEIEFLGALNLPMGPGGTEFGGIGVGVPGVYLSNDLAVFAQLAWYF